jgi:glycerol-3-phosphate acyltransferase PlsY
VRRHIRSIAGFWYDEAMALSGWSVAWIVGGYLCGSVPFGLLIGLARGTDLRQVGSGNIGATNASRMLGLRWGLICFGLDALKGWLPVYVAGVALGLVGKQDISAVESWLWISVAAAAVLGHVFPVWLGLRGGKGVATGFGVLLGFWPILTVPVLASLGIWLACALTWRYISLASICAAVTLPLFVAVWARLDDGDALGHRWPFLTATVAMALLVIVKHRTNLIRLRQGTEPKIGPRK